MLRAMVWLGGSVACNGVVRAMQVLRAMVWLGQGKCCVQWCG